MIIGLSGNLSGGKTVSAVRYAYKKGLEGKRVISNIKLNFPAPIKYEFMSNSLIVDFIKENYEDSDAIRSRFSNAVIILDEIVNLLSARKSNSALNELMTNWFMMLGKLSSDVLMTYQLGSSQLDNRVREAILTKEGFCFRLNERKQIMLDNTERKVDQKVYIMVIWIENLGLVNRGYQEIYDPEDYYKFYDTEEITLLNRNLYTKGGSKDLTKNKWDIEKKKFQEKKEIKEYNQKPNDLEKYFDFS